ncbi:MAG: hypothetical protein WCH40_11195 [Verrucomicrobiales bacterium]
MHIYRESGLSGLEFPMPGFQVREDIDRSNILVHLAFNSISLQLGNGDSVLQFHAQTFQFDAFSILHGIRPGFVARDRGKDHRDGWRDDEGFSHDCIQCRAVNSDKISFGESAIIPNSAAPRLIAKLWALRQIR